LTAGTAVWLAAADTPEFSTGRLAVVLFAGCALVIAGLLAVVNGEQRIGVLTAAAGLAWLLERLLQAIPTSATFTLGEAMTGLWAAFLAHALISFPSGRLDGTVERVVVIAGYLLNTVGNLPELAYFQFSAWFPHGGPSFLLSIREDPDLALTMSRIFDSLTLAYVVAMLVLLVRRALRASPPTRRALGAVWLAGAAFFGLGILVVTAGLGWVSENDAYGIWLERTVGVVPVVLAGALIVARLAQDRLVTLVIDLERRDPAMDLRQALRRSLDDPSLDVVYWRAESGGWIDDAGLPVTLPDADADRAVTPIKYGSEDVGALVHDPILLRSPERMQTACAAAGLALDNERLKADLRARLDDLRESRARIVEAGDRERRRVERNLHDGAQQRLMGVAMVVRLAEARAQGLDTELDGLLIEAASDVDAAIRELRELARGLHPAILTDVGLQGALEALAERSAVPVQLSLEVAEPLPESSETGAYYVVAEALANITKHAQASRAAVRVMRRNGLLCVEVSDDGKGGAQAAPGSGLEGLADRVDSLGGRLRLDSPPGNGTVLTVELPCA
jgi:signal transduction histidine kinase